MVSNSKILFWVVIFTLVSLAESDYHKQKRSLIYPGTTRSLLGIFIAIAVPIELPDINVFVSYNFEANYYLPVNTSELGDLTLFAPITTQVERMGRSLSRKLTYQILEQNFKKEGFPPRPCLLRSICEASEYPVDHNGVLGGIVHIIFTPSSSEDESLPDEFYRAEKLGKEKNCIKYVEKCPSSLLDIISKIMNK